MSLIKSLKQWMLPIAMMTGASLYIIYHFMPEPVHRLGPFLSGCVGFMQPLLIFLMLFFTFCGLEPRQLKPHRWHWWLLLVQGGVFVLAGLLAWALSERLSSESYVLMESVMLCFICPTATAAAVVTRKLGGDVPGITTYIVLINIVTAVLVPLIVPLVHPENGVSFAAAFSMILAKVFPLLITQCLCAWLVRYLMPKLLRRIQKYPDLPFYLWSVALTLAITVTTKSIAGSSLEGGLLLQMSLVSLVSCVIQFALGRWIGGRLLPRKPFMRTSVPEADDAALVKQPQSVTNINHGQSAETDHSADGEVCRRNRITAGQSLGQKNTVFSIWMGYTFMTPETAIIGGLYSIWHNVYNSWQLRRTME